MKRLLTVLTATVLSSATALAQENSFAPGLAPFRNLADVGNRFVAASNLLDVKQRAPLRTDDSNSGFAVNDMWCALGQCWVALSVSPGAAFWQSVGAGNISSTVASALPLDVPGVTAQFAAGTMLMTRNPATVTLNKSIDLWRASDQTTKTIGWAGNYIDAATADYFCQPSWLANKTCEISKVYDQSYNVSTGTLNSNDATATPGWLVVTAAVHSGGGGSGCTNGSQVFTVVGGAGAAATATGTVTGGVLGGALTVTTGSYATQPGASAVATTGGGCSVQPTLDLTYDQNAPQWTTKTLGKGGPRIANFSGYYNGGVLGVQQGVGNQMSIPAGMALDPSTVTLMAALQSKDAIYFQDTLFTIGPAANGQNMHVLYAGGATQPGFFSGAATGINTHNGPAVWSFVTNVVPGSISINNATGTIPAKVSQSFTGGWIGGGLGLASRKAVFDLAGMAVWNSRLSATALQQTEAAFYLEAGIAPQTRKNLLLPVGDSITYGFASLSSSEWVQQMFLKPGLPVTDWINLGYGGAQFVGGTWSWLAQHSTVAGQLPLSSYSNVVVPIALGTNDIGVQCGTSCIGFNTTVYARAQVEHAFWQSQGSNIKTVAVTILPRTDATCTTATQCQTEILAYNALVRANWALPVSQGGLGASALCDVAADPLWSNGALYPGYLSGGAGIHPNDPGYEDYGVTCAPVIAALIN